MSYGKEMLGRYPGMMPPKSQMFGNPGFGMWDRQPRTGMPQTYAQSAQQIGSPTGGMFPQGQMGILAQILARQPNQGTQQPAQPTPGTDGMISPDMLRQLMGGGFGGLLGGF
jgi:hypothetical protein